MDWVKLTTNYYLDPAIMRAGEDAEVLFTRALAYVGDHETDGVIPKEALPRLTPLRSSARARALVREGLWEVIPGGWKFPQWSKHQSSKEQMQAQRDAARQRQARHRRRNGVTDAVTNTVSDGGVTGTEVEVEVEVEVDAAAAAKGAAAAADPVLEVLRSKLQAHTPLRGLRFDTLQPDQVTKLRALVDLHGDDPLVRVAIDTCRNPAPTHAGAFLGTWEALPPPGRPLHVVRQRYCDTHKTPLTPAGVCSSCASDTKAGNR